jgi:hypothetical protein
MEECGGYNELTVAQVAPIFERVTGVREAGFSETVTGWWVRPKAHGTFQILHFLRNQRGVDYRFRWGIALPWVPRLSRGKLRWHRTLKAAEFDLWDQAHDYLIRTDTPWQEADVYFPDRSLGPTCFEQDLTACWNRIDRAINTWWDDGSDPAGVLRRADEQVQRSWEGARHAPDPALVSAFALARMGRLPEAITRLEGASYSAESSPMLRAGLEEVARTSSVSKT